MTDDMFRMGERILKNKENINPATKTTICYYFTIASNPLAPQVSVLIEAGQDNQQKKRKYALKNP